MSKRALAKLIYISGLYPDYTIHCNITGVKFYCHTNHYAAACRIVRCLREYYGERYD